MVGQPIYKYMYDGKERSISELAKIAGLSYATFLNRLHKLGFSVERAMTHKSFKCNYQGNQVSMSELSKLTGIKKCTLQLRLKRQGMSVEDAVNKKLLGDLGVTIPNDGYAYVSGKDGKNGRLHIKIAEKALGKPLPKGALVHHVDGNRLNNVNSNLCICPNDAYHFLIHARTRAYESCGNANYLKCIYCGKYDDPINLKKNNRKCSFHRICHNTYHREKRQKSKQAASITA